jgi:hypothetical protein
MEVTTMRVPGERRFAASRRSRWLDPMTRDSTAATVALAVAVSVSAAIASAIGVLGRGDGAIETVTSVRGETYDMLTSGVYAYNAERVVAEGVGWDLFTLLVAVPVTLVAAWLMWRGSFGGRLVVAGMFGYFLYQYLEYSVTWAFGPLFPLWIGIYAASLVGLGGISIDLARVGITDRFDRGYPRRAWPALMGAMSLLLTLMWLGRIAKGLTDGVDGLLFGMTTMTVTALDLGLVVPISVALAVLTWRRSAVGTAVAAAYVVTFVAMSAAITSMLLSAWAVERVAEAVPIGIFGSAIVLGLWLAFRIRRSIVGGPVRRTGAIPTPTPA